MQVKHCALSLLATGATQPSRGAFSFPLFIMVRWTPTARPRHGSATGQPSRGHRRPIGRPRLPCKPWRPLFPCSRPSSPHNTQPLPPSPWMPSAARSPASPRPWTASASTTSVCYFLSVHKFELGAPPPSGSSSSPTFGRRRQP